MVEETFIASDPKTAYDQAVEKYGEDISLLSAKQLKYDDGVIRCEITIAVPLELFKNRSLIDNSSEDEKEMLGEITELKNQLELMKDELFPDIRKKEKVVEEDIVEEVKNIFASKGISKKWLDKCCDSIKGTSFVEDKELLASYLMEDIDETLRVKEEKLGDGLKVMMFVGPTGVGKTTTIAKLAARYSYLLPKQYKVALINLDNFKVGATEQLEHYADMMQIEHIAVASVDEFKKTLEELKEYDVVLVDTAGMSPYDTKKFVQTAEFLNTDITLSIEVNLVLSATVKYEDMEDIYMNFSFLDFNSVVISKFDETKHFGTLLNFMLLYDLPMSYFSIGQKVPDDLLLASKEYLLEQFIGDINGV